MFTENENVDAIVDVTETPLIETPVPVKETIKKPRKAKTAKTVKAKAGKTQKAKKAKKESEPEKPKAPTYIDYTKPGLKGRPNDAKHPQTVVGFNEDRKRGKRGSRAFTIFRYLLKVKAQSQKLNIIELLKEAQSLERRNKQLEAYEMLTLVKVSAQELVDFVQKEHGVDLAKEYKGHYPDCPLHQAMHSLSKPETRETRKDAKTKELKDSFAVGARALVRKDGRVGIGTNGFYYANPNYLEDYNLDTIEKVDARTAAHDLLATMGLK